MTLKISSRLVGDVVIMDLSDRITLGEHVLLKNSVKSLLADGKRKILLNIADVDYIDSAGLEALAMAAVEPRRQGGVLKLLSPTKRVRDVLQITKLYMFFDVFTDETKALESFSGPPLRCCCPLCGYASGPPVLDTKWIWPPQVCRNARCEATFTVLSSGGESQTVVKSVRIQTYKDEYFELLSGPPFTVKIVGRLDLFSSPALKKAWQALPVPRRVLFDMSGTKEMDELGQRALLQLLAGREKDARVVVCLEGLGSEQAGTFPTGPPFYQNKATALAALGDVSDTPPLLARVTNE